MTVKANNMSKTYGDDDPEELTTTITGLKRNDDRSVIDYDIVRAEGENAGSYTITPTGVANQGNYNVTYSTGTFKINKRKLSADFVGLDKVSFQASGDNHSPNVVFSKYTPVTLNTDYRVSGETTANDAGVHEITVTGIGTNFTGSVVLRGILQESVTKRLPMTVSHIPLLLVMVKPILHLSRKRRMPIIH